MHDREWLEREHKDTSPPEYFDHLTPGEKYVRLDAALLYGEYCRSEGRGTCKNLWGEEGFRCSECGASSLEGFYCDSTQEQKEGRLVYGDSFDDYKYCPCCGAEVVQ